MHQIFRHTLIMQCPEMNESNKIKAFILGFVAYNVFNLYKLSLRAFKSLIKMSNLREINK